jgi:hypothetical protein
MAGILQRLNTELETFGKRAQQALDEGRLQLEKFRLQRDRDEAARKLGYLMHRRERGQTVDSLEVDAWLVRIDTLDGQISKIEREMAATKGEVVSVSETPAPASAQETEAEVK